jgi:phage antirepressor YoqD-like protein
VVEQKQALALENTLKQKLIAEAAPKVEFVDRYVDSTGLKGFRQVAKLLNIKEPEFREFLDRREIMYRLGGEWTAKQPHIDAKRFEVKAGSSELNGHAFNSCKFTPKGVTWIAGLMAAEKALLALGRSAANDSSGNIAA